MKVDLSTKFLSTVLVVFLKPIIMFLFFLFFNNKATFLDLRHFNTLYDGITS